MKILVVTSEKSSHPNILAILKNIHSRDITKNNNKPIPLHMLSHGEQHADMIPQILEVVKKDPSLESTLIFRQKREIHWIHSLARH